MVTAKGDHINASVVPEISAVPPMVTTKRNLSDKVEAHVVPEVSAVAPVVTTKHLKDGPSLIVLNFLKSSNKPVTSEEIAKSTGLTTKQVSNAFTVLKNVQNISKEREVWPGKYGNTTRNQKRTLYSWGGEK